MNEVLNVPPSRWYLTGFLVPWSAPIRQKHDDDDAQGELGFTEPTTAAHAKCVLIDDEVALVTSANFTEWAQARNVEAGALVRSRHFATQLRRQMESLVESMQVRRLPGF